MNKDTFDENWIQIRSQSTHWWSLMSEFDLKKVDKAENKLDKYATLLQVKYGYNRKQAKEEISGRLAELLSKQTETDGEIADKSSG